MKKINIIVCVLLIFLSLSELFADEGTIKWSYDLTISNPVSCFGQASMSSYLSIICGDSGCRFPENSRSRSDSDSIHSKSSQITSGIETSISNIEEDTDAEVFTFASLKNPKAVAVDSLGNVYVACLSIFDEYKGFYRFDPDGTLTARNNSLFGEFRFAIDEQNAIIWALETEGGIYLIDPETLEAFYVLDVDDLWSSPASVVNLLDNEIDHLYNINTQYGDIAITHVDETGYDILITGQNATGGNQFILRFHLDFTLGIQNPKIVLATFPLPTPTVPPPFDTQPPGLAASDDGTVLTAMLDHLSGGITPWYIASFKALEPCPEIDSPGFVSETYGDQVVSFGMTYGNPGGGFYFVTSVNGLGPGPASVYHMNETLDQVTCIADLTPIGVANMGPFDVAVDKNNGNLYVTLPSDNMVLKILTTAPCSFSIFPTTKSFSPSGGSQVVTVDASRSDCSWTASESLSWVSLNTTSGTGDGSVTVTVSANSDAERSGTVTIAGETFLVSQEAVACSYSISPMSQSFNSNGGSQVVTVDASRSDCSWTASESLSWVSLNTTSGTGDGSVTVTVSANSGAERSGIITIAGKFFSISQKDDSFTSYEVLTPESNELTVYFGEYIKPELAA